MLVRLYIFVILLFQWKIPRIHCETVHGCTNNNQQSNKPSVTLSCANNGYILVQNLTFGVRKTSNPTCSYQSGDCTIRTTYIGMECNGLQKCNLDLNPQYLHICSQYSDYMVLDYLCLSGESLSICDNRSILTRSEHQLLLRSSNYPNEYGNSLNCSCEINTNKAKIKFLDFYLEERDEMNLCSRDYLQIGNRSYCDSTVDQTIDLNSSIQLKFKTNDMITRKGFWFMINSDQSMQVSCRNSFESPFPSTKIVWIPLSTTTNSSHLHSTRRSTLSSILLVTIIFVVVLLLLNLLLIILCWRQRRSKESINSKTSTTHRPFFCSKRSETSSSSSITYGEASLDIQKRQTTSTTTATTGIYEDPNDVLTLQRQQKLHSHPSLYFQHRPVVPKTFCPIILPACPADAGYNPMIHYPIPPTHCHFNRSAQTFYPLDSQHIYETIQDGQCPYQRLAATLRRQQQQCTCYCTHNEQKLVSKTDDHDKAIIIEPNPETLV